MGNVAVTRVMPQLGAALGLYLSVSSLKGSCADKGLMIVSVSPCLCSESPMMPSAYRSACQQRLGSWADTEY